MTYIGYVTGNHYQTMEYFEFPNHQQQTDIITRKFVSLFSLQQECCPSYGAVGLVLVFHTDPR